MALIQQGQIQEGVEKYKQGMDMLASIFNDQPNRKMVKLIYNFGFLYTKIMDILDYPTALEYYRQTLSQLKQLK